MTHSFFGEVPAECDEDRALPTVIGRCAFLLIHFRIRRCFAFFVAVWNNEK